MPPVLSSPDHSHQLSGTSATARASMTSTMRYHLAKRSSSCSRFPAVVWASDTRAVSCAAVESPGSESTRTVSTPVWLVVPAVTLSPGRLATGRASPVMRLSSTDDLPERTVPSTGTRAPGLRRSASPSTTSSIAFSAPPSSVTVEGSRPPSIPACCAVWCTHHFCTASERTKKNTMAAASQNWRRPRAPPTASVMSANMLRRRS
mmetsp:Transcript_607/g.2064  ORF Transcript_607/g.2064 Transcript_607/m.2064 type:complete len:205 (+) Transcript_607:2342-2956(+)